MSHRPLGGVTGAAQAACQETGATSLQLGTETDSAQPTWSDSGAENQGNKALRSEERSEGVLGEEGGSHTGALNTQWGRMGGEHAVLGAGRGAWPCSSPLCSSPQPAGSEGIGVKDKRWKESKTKPCVKDTKRVPMLPGTHSSQNSYSSFLCNSHRPGHAVFLFAELGKLRPRRWGRWGHQRPHQEPLSSC